jgi:hypothetical protein
LFLSPYINVLLTKAFQHLADDAFHVLLINLASAPTAAAQSDRRRWPGGLRWRRPGR